MKVLTVENLIKSRERVQKFGEVFTPQWMVEKMLDELPQEFFSDLEQKFLEPAAGEGAFLIAILNRKLNFADSPEKMLAALKSLFAIELQPDNLSKTRENLQQIFLNHYEKNFGEPTEEILSDVEKILENNLVEGDALHFFAEHQSLIKEKFLTLAAEDFSDAVIVSNPPYQEDSKNKNTQQARPLYHHFVEQSKNLNPQNIVMITPSRWFAGGMGLDSFRNKMMQDKHIKTLVDFTNAKDCFPNNDISGGVCYFVWSKNYFGDCKFINVHNGKADEMIRPLDEFSVLVRYNKAIPIIRKVTGGTKNFLSEIISPISPFGLPTKIRGGEKKNNSDVKVFSSGGAGYLPRSEILRGLEYLDRFKVLISQTGAEHAGEPGNDGKFRVLTSSMRVLKPNEVCTHSYLVEGFFDNDNEPKNLLRACW